MAGHSNWQTFWVHHNAQQHPAADVKPNHKDTNVYYHFRAPKLALGLYLNENVEGKKGIGTYLRGFRGEDKSISRPRLLQHQQQLMSALGRAAVVNNDAPPRQHDDMYGDYSVFHEIDIDDPQNWQQMSDWFENMRQVYVGVLGAPSASQGSGLKSSGAAKLAAMPDEHTQERSALERAAERYLEKEADRDRANNAAAGCLGVCCIAVVVMVVIGGLLTLLGIA